MKLLNVKPIAEIFIIVVLWSFLGWEYTVDTSVASYVAVEKTYHMSRRRRWVRSRNLVKSTDKEGKVRLVVLLLLLVLDLFTSENEKDSTLVLQVIKNMNSQSTTH